MEKIGSRREFLKSASGVGIGLMTTALTVPQIWKSASYENSFTGKVATVSVTKTGGLYVASDAETASEQASQRSLSALLNTLLANTDSAITIKLNLEGTHSLDATVHLPSHVCILGNGEKVTVLKTGGFDGPAFINRDPANGNDHVMLTHLTLDLNGAGSNHTGSIHFANVSDSELSHLEIRNAGKSALEWTSGADGASSRRNRLSHCVFSSGAGNALVLLDMQESQILFNRFEQATDSVGAALVLKNRSKNLLLAHNLFQAMAGNGIVVESGTNLFIKENVINGAGRNGIALLGDEAAPCRFVRIVSNQIYACGTQDPALFTGISAEKLESSVITDNFFYACASDGMRTTELANSSVSGNQYC